MLRDLRYAARALARNRGFTLLAVMTLALGIGATTGVFSAIHAILLRPLPVKDSARLVTLYSFNQRASGYPYTFTSYPDFLEYRDEKAVFSAAACALNANFNLRVGEQTERIYGTLVSPDYFDVLGVPAALGRTFESGEQGPVLVLGYDFWQRRLAGDHGVLGRTVFLNGQPLTVVGVAPHGLRGLRLHEAPQFWAPLAWLRPLLPILPPDALARRELRMFAVVGRLQPGLQTAAAETALRRIPRAPGWTVALIPSNQDRFASIWKQRIETFLGVAGAAAVLLLLLACANVANLQLLRAAVRQREVAVRLALGAGRGRLLRQLLGESVLLAMLAAVAGLGVAVWIVKLMQAFQQPFLAHIEWEGRLDWRVLGFSLGAAALSGVLFGLAPAWQAGRTELVASLKTRGATGAARRRTLEVLAGAQVMLSFVLLIGAVLFLRSLARLGDVDPGFRSRGLLLATVDAVSGRRSAAASAAFWRQVEERMRSIPGVRAVGLARTPPLSTVQSIARRAGEWHAFNSVSPGYFETMGIPIVAGRGFTPHDSEAIVVNQTMARQYPNLPFVGVARDARYKSLWEPAAPYAYTPFRPESAGEVTLHLAIDGDAVGVAAALRRELYALDKDLPVEIMTVERRLADSLAGPRMMAAVAGLFSLAALLLAGIGLYGVMAHAVGRRAQEIGLRLALGAGRPQVLWLFLRRGLTVMAAGGAAGFAAAFLLSRGATALLHGVTPADPAAYGLAAALLAVVATAACLLPARRAARLDPAISLREE